MLRDFNWRVLTKLALLAGLAQVVAGVGMYLLRLDLLPWSFAINLGVLMYCIVLFTSLYRKSALKGRINYRQALVLGIVITVFSSIVYAIYNLISVGLSARTIALSNLILFPLFGIWLAIFAAFYSRKLGPKEYI